MCSHPGQESGRRPDSPSSLSSPPQLGRPHYAVSSSCCPCHCCPGSGLFPVRVASLQVPTHIPPNSTGHSKTYISGCPSLLKTFRGLTTPTGRDPGFLRGLQTCYLASLALQPHLPPHLALGSPQSDHMTGGLQHGCHLPLLFVPPDCSVWHTIPFFFFLWPLFLTVHTWPPPGAFPDQFSPALP